MGNNQPDILTRQDFWENQRLVPPNSKGAKETHAYLQDIAKHLLGDTHDIDGDPIDFVIMDDDAPNAFFLGKDKAGNDRHVIAVSKGLAHLCESEDELAFVLGHELTHLLFNIEYGQDKQNTKAEEGLSDLNSVEMLHNAGYNAEAAKTIHNKIHSAGNANNDFLQVLDVHPLDSSREIGIDALLSKLNRNGDVARRNIRTLPQNIKDNFANANHTGYFDEIIAQTDFEFMSIRERYDFILDHIDETVEDGVFVDARGNALLDAFRDINEIYRNERIALLNDATELKKFEEIDLEERLRFKKQLIAKDRNELTDGLKVSLFMATYTATKISHFEELPEFQKLENHIKEFIASDTYEEAVKNAANINHAMRQRQLLHSIPKSKTYDRDQIVESFAFSNFVLPDKKEAIGKTVPWNRFIEWSKEDKNGNIKKVLFQHLGITDYRNASKSDALEDGFSISIPKPPYDKKGKNKPYFCDVDQNGKILRTFNTYSKWQSNVQHKSIVNDFLSYWDDVERQIAEETADIERTIEAYKNEDWEFLIDKYSERIHPLAEHQKDGFKEQARKGNFVNWDFQSVRRNVLADVLGRIKHLKSYKPRNHKDNILGSYSTLDFPILKENQDVSDRLAEEKLEDGLLEKYFEIFNLLKGDGVENIEQYTSIFLSEHAGLLSEKEQERVIEYVLEKNPDIFSEQAILKMACKHPFRLIEQELSNIREIKKQGALDYKAYQPLYLDKIRKKLGYESPNNYNDILNLKERLPSYTNSKELLNFESFICCAKSNDNNFPLTDLIKAVGISSNSNSLINYYKTLEYQKVLEPYILNKENWSASIDEQVECFNDLRREKLFYKDRKALNATTEWILSEINEQSPQKRIELTATLLSKKNRFDDPDFRKEVLEIWSDAILELHGKDDRTKDYREKINAYADEIKEHSALADKPEILNTLSNKLLSQKELANDLKVEPKKLTEKELKDTHMFGTAGEAILYVIDRNPDSANQLIDFLIKPNTDENCNEIRGALIKEQEKLNIPMFDNLIEVHKSAEDFDVMHREFWSLPIEARAVLIKRILPKRQSWEQTFEFMEDKLIDKTHPDAKTATDCIHSYIEARESYEREFLIAGMMVATQAIEGKKQDIGLALKTFLESMDAATRKFGQGIHSSPNTPEDIRQGLDGIKDSAAKPQRCEIYEWIEASVPESVRNEISYVGEILGSASYFVTVEVFKNDGSKSVLSLLRPEAREEAEHGFGVLEKTGNNLLTKAENRKERKLYQTISSFIKRNVVQAKNMVGIETSCNHHGIQQVRTARELYDGLEVTVGENSFSFYAAPWLSCGENYKEMEMVEGLPFDKLGEDTPEDRQFKKNFGQGYFAVELINILRGGRFDHDRHEKQLHIEGNRAGIFDTGAMAIKDPTKQEKRMLGKVIGKVLIAGARGKDPVASFEQILGTLNDKGKDTTYLTEVQRGVLALSEFHKGLSNEEKMQTFKFAVENAPMDRDIEKGMGFIGKKMLKMAFKGVENPNIKIAKETGLEMIAEPVVHKEGIAPKTQRQTDVSRLFTDRDVLPPIPNQKGGKPPTILPMSPRIPQQILSAMQACVSLDTYRPRATMVSNSPASFVEMVKRSRIESNNRMNLR